MRPSLNNFLTNMRSDYFMRYLSKNDLHAVSGATVVNNLSSGTKLQGVAKDIVDINTGAVSTIVLYAWGAESGGFLMHWYNNTPYYFNENYLSSMPEISPNNSQSYNWEGFVA
jgi:hypothetical protein